MNSNTFGLNSRSVKKRDMLGSRPAQTLTAQEQGSPKTERWKRPKPRKDITHWRAYTRTPKERNKRGQQGPKTITNSGLGDIWPWRKTAMRYVIRRYGYPSHTGSPADGAVTGRRVERGDPPGNPAARDRSEGEGRGGGSKGRSWRCWRCVVVVVVIRPHARRREA